MEATFFFDPLCPFTWRTARWLVAVAPERDITVRWRSFSLPLLNAGAIPEEFSEVAEQYRAPAEASTRAMRLIESLSAAGDDASIGRFYTELGTRTHDAATMIDDAVVRTAAEQAGIAGAAAVLDDPAWDEAIRASLQDALRLAGPGIGSPVLHLEGASRGLYGPVLDLTGELSADDRLVVWDATAALMRVNAFFEVKRGRVTPVVE